VLFDRYHSLGGMSDQSSQVGAPKLAHGCTSDECIPQLLLFACATSRSVHSATEQPSEINCAMRNYRRASPILATAALLLLGFVRADSSTNFAALAGDGYFVAAANLGLANEDTVQAWEAAARANLSIWRNAMFAQTMQVCNAGFSCWVNDPKAGSFRCV
jgi:hypothetical protein